MCLSRAIERAKTLKRKYESAQEAHQKALESCAKALNDVREAAEAQAAAQQIAQAIQVQLHTRVAVVVTRCLQTVFDDPYEFRIIFEQSRGKTEARMVFVRDGIEVDPLTASGGGIVDVAAFALRLTCIMLMKPAVRRTIILDEPFKFVSAQYRERVRSLLEILSEEMGVQFIMVTHLEEMRCGKVIEIF